MLPFTEGRIEGYRVAEGGCSHNLSSEQPHTGAFRIKFEHNREKRVVSKEFSDMTYTSLTDSFILAYKKKDSVRKDLTISWKDEEDDEIAISSTEELQIALKSMIENKREVFAFKVLVQEEDNIDSCTCSCIEKEKDNGSVQSLEASAAVGCSGVDDTVDEEERDEENNDDNEVDSYVCGDNSNDDDCNDYCESSSSSDDDNDEDRPASVGESCTLNRKCPSTCLPSRIDFSDSALEKLRSDPIATECQMFNCFCASFVSSAHDAELCSCNHGWTVHSPI
jgi:hypothetical protein